MLFTQVSGAIQPASRVPAVGGMKAYMSLLFQFSKPPKGYDKRKKADTVTLEQEEVPTAVSRCILYPQVHTQRGRLHFLSCCTARA